jgi:uncharacterized membrane protein YedE/YeeE
MSDFFPLGWSHYLLGGLIIGLGVSLMFVCQGRVVGMSSVFSSTLSWFSHLNHFQQEAYLNTRTWRLLCALGLVLGAALWWVWLGPVEGVHTQISTWRLLLGGILVGYGSRLSNGCTSGHGICGLSSLSIPSLVAVLVFMGVAIATALVLSAMGA